MYKKESIKPYIIQVMALKLPQKEALSYLADRGFKISRQYLNKLEKQIRDSRFSRLSLIAKEQFIDQHLDRITVLETIQHEMWSLFNNESNNFKKAQILMQIAELQTFISSYYDSSQYIMQRSIQEEKHNVPQ